MTLHVSHRQLTRALLSLALTAFGIGTVAGCQSSTPPPSCAAGTQSYDGHCLSNASITYIECTKDKGFDFTSDVGGGLSGTFRAIVGVSVNAAVKKSKQEDTPVALQIVKSCLTLAEQPTQTAADKQATQQYADQVDQTLQQWEQKQVESTPHIKLSRSTAAAGEEVTITGKSFWSNETIDIIIQATLITQVPADGQGDFTVTITIPAAGVPVNFPTTITASGETSAKSAESPFTRTG